MRTRVEVVKIIFLFVCEGMIYVAYWSSMPLLAFLSFNVLKLNIICNNTFVTDLARFVITLEYCL